MVVLKLILDKRYKKKFWKFSRPQAEKRGVIRP